MATGQLIMLMTALLSGVMTAEPATLSVTTILAEPYIMPKGSSYEGYCMDLLALLSENLDFKYKLHLVKDGFYGTVDGKGNWNGMIGEIVRGEADLAVGPLTLTYTRETAVDMTTPFMSTGLSFILSKDSASEEQQYLSFLKSFSTEMWVGILIAYLATSVCIYLVARISPYEWENPHTEENDFTFLHSLWYTAGSLSLQGVGPHPKALSGRVISVIWWIFSLVLLAGFFANLYLWLPSDKNELSIMNFEDLANQNVIEYGTINGSSSRAFFKNSKDPTYIKIYEQMERLHSYSNTMEEGVRRAKEGGYAFIGESVSLDLTVQRNCDLIRSPEVIGMRGYSIAASLGSPMVKNLSMAILRLSESGTLSHLKNKWWRSSCISSNAKVTTLTMTNMKSVFIFLALGLMLGLLLALLELGAKSRGTASSQQKPCCSVLSAEISQRFGGTGEKAIESSEKCTS